jgi:alpha-tubulin suppressor-like RCC1 family protein
VAGLDNVTAIAAGAGHSLAVSGGRVSAGLAHTLATDASGRIWGWGWNVFGQVGDGTTTDQSSPTLARPGTGAEVPSAGWAHSMTSNLAG